MSSCIVAVFLLLVAAAATAQTHPAAAPLPPRQSNVTLTVTRVNESGEPRSPKTDKPHPAGSVYQDRIAIRVVDENGRPVPQAKVTFALPQPNNPAALTNGYRSGETLPPIVVETDIEGVADICGHIGTCPLRANRLGGDVHIAVSIDFHGDAGSGELIEINKAPPLFTKKRAIIIGAAVAAVVIPVILLRSPHATISTVSPTGPVIAP